MENVVICVWFGIACAFLHFHHFDAHMCTMNSRYLGFVGIALRLLYSQSTIHFFFRYCHFPMNVYKFNLENCCYELSINDVIAG